MAGCGVPAGAVGHTGRTASEGREVQQLGSVGQVEREAAVLND